MLGFNMSIISSFIAQRSVGVEGGSEQDRGADGRHRTEQRAPLPRRAAVTPALQRRQQQPHSEERIPLP